VQKMWKGLEIMPRPPWGDQVNL